MELKTELTFLDKLKSWKRWMAALGAVVPIIVQAATGAMGWPLAIVLSVVALAVGVLGLAKEDAARLTAAGTAIAAAISKDGAVTEEEVEVEFEEDEDEEDDEEWEDEDEEDEE